MMNYKNPTSDLTTNLNFIFSLTNCRLIGSRYYGNYHISSDRDYATLYHNTNKLLQFGFTPINNSIEYNYYLDNLTSEVLRKVVIDCNNNISNIDVQICNSQKRYEKKCSLQSYIRDNYLYQLPRIYFRNFVWELSNLFDKDKTTITPLYCIVHNLVKEYIDDMSAKRFYMICNELLHTDKVNPHSRINTFESYPNYECFAYMWQIKFGIN